MRSKIFGLFVILGAEPLHMALSPWSGESAREGTAEENINWRVEFRSGILSLQSIIVERLLMLGKLSF
jgi:hypothetical protein